MSAADLALVVAVVLCAFGFAALVVALVRVNDTLHQVRREVQQLRSETAPLIADMRETTSEARAAMQTARADLDRFDRVLGSAEGVADAVEESSRAARRVFSAPVIKAAGLAAGARRAGQRLRKPSAEGHSFEVIEISDHEEHRRA